MEFSPLIVIVIVFLVHVTIFNNIQSFTEVTESTTFNSSSHRYWDLPLLQQNLNETCHKLMLATHQSRAAQLKNKKLAKLSPGQNATKRQLQTQKS